MKKGFVLEGGAMRGLFTAGILDVMMSENIKPDGIIGVSAGAAFGCNYKSGQQGRALRYNIEYCRDARYCSIRSLIKTGDMYGADFCYHELPEKLDVFDTQAFEKSDIEFYLVCTDIEKGVPVYHKMNTCDFEELEWMRASASMPLVSRVVEVGGRKLLDGGITDSIPLKYFQSIGYEKNLVILTQTKEYRKKPNKMMPVIRKRLKEYPALIDAMERRHEEYNKTLEYIWQQEKQGNTLVLCPPEPLPVKRISHNKQALLQTYNIGKELAQKRIGEIKEFFKN